MDLMDLMAFAKFWSSEQRKEPIRKIALYWLVQNGILRMAPLKISHFLLLKNIQQMFWR